MKGANEKQIQNNLTVSLRFKSQEMLNFAMQITKLVQITSSLKQHSSRGILYLCYGRREYAVKENWMQLDGEP